MHDCVSRHSLSSTRSNWNATTSYCSPELAVNQPLNRVLLVLPLRTRELWFRTELNRSLLLPDVHNDITIIRTLTIHTTIQVLRRSSRYEWPRTTSSDGGANSSV